MADPPFDLPRFDTDDPAERRETAGRWTKDRMRKWQAAWHDLYDADPALAATGEFARPEPLPDDPMCDIRLCHGFARATVETRAACFALFPSGAEMHRRFELFRARPRVPLSEVQARDLVQELARASDRADPSEPLDWPAITVVADREEAEAMVYASDSVRDIYDSAPHLTPQAVLESATSIFLSEPLYVAAGNVYEPGDWITAALLGPERDRVFALLDDLAAGGWWVRLTESGVALLRLGKT